MKKSILLDVDEVVCFPGFLKAANDFLGTDYKIDDFSDYYLDSVAIPKGIFIANLRSSLTFYTYHREVYLAR